MTRLHARLYARKDESIKMGRFQGIDPQAVWLLAENRFRDSKSYYEEHKPEIREKVLLPLRDLQADLAPSMLRIDPRLVVDPNRNNSISRVRRDNRFTRDKSMYRENMWLAFERDKKAWEFTPGFFVEISPRGSEWGMGFYRVSPAFLQFLRRRIDADPRPYSRAVKKALAYGFASDAQPYARPKRTDIPPELDGLYNRKCIDMVKTEPDPAFFGSSELADTLLEGFAALTPLYRLLTAAVEAWVESGGDGV